MAKALIRWLSQPFRPNRLVHILRPSAVVRVMAEEITKGAVLARMNGKQLISHGKDPLSSLVALIVKALSRGDRRAVSEGLSGIAERVSDLYRDKAFTKTEGLRILNHLIPFMERIERAAAEAGDHRSCQEVLRVLGVIGKTAADYEHFQAAMGVANSLGSIGLAGLKRGDGLLAIKSVEALSSLGSHLGGLQRYYEMARIVRSIEAVGKVLGCQRNEMSAFGVVSSLETLGLSAARHKLKMPAALAVKAIETIGRITADQGMSRALWMARQSLRALRTELEEQGMHFAFHQAESACRTLEDVSRSSSEDEKHPVGK